MSNEKVYIIYDGRAMHDTDAACVLEVCDNGRGDLREALYTWRGHDAVLVEYSVAADGRTLENERLIGHLREGRRALIAKLTTSKAVAAQESESRKFGNGGW